MPGKVIVAKALAEKHGGRYHRGRGPDIRTDKIIINVETSRSLQSACGRLRGFRGPVYIACANDRDLDKARGLITGKTIGLMNSAGRILKKSTRGRWP